VPSAAAADHDEMMLLVLVTLLLLAWATVRFGPEVDRHHHC
jgi:hypothetical protein